MSVSAHGAAYASLSAQRAKMPLPRRAIEVNMELKSLPKPRPTVEVPPAREPERAARPTRASAPPTSQPVDAAPAPKAAATAAAPLDLSGVTLTNDTGSGLALPVGDGGPLRLAAGNVGEAPQPATVNAKRIVMPPLVAAADLSEHPRPPALAGLLRANYPEAARQRGLSGSARVRARIDAAGVIGAAELLSESTSGFGAACRRTVLGSHWSAPRDKNGRPCATEIVYTCHFEVDP